MRAAPSTFLITSSRCCLGAVILGITKELVGSASIRDVEGLRVTLNSAELKLAQMYKLQSRNDREVVELGIPRTRT
jgi:hypothetical protein